MSVDESNRVKSQREVRDFLAGDPRKYVAYVDGTGKYLTTWMGDELAKVTHATTSARRGFHGVRFTVLHVRATDAKGRHWSGTGRGRNMYIRIRRVQKSRKSAWSQLMGR